MALNDDLLDKLIEGYQKPEDLILSEQPLRLQSLLEVQEWLTGCHHS
jgi:hypothetical protein